MPEISRFFGIVIKMFFDDLPTPHIHAEYGGTGAKIAIRSGDLMVGHLSPRAYRLVKEWVELHRAELLENWERGETMQPLLRIKPLD
jgi:hypothetical protein